MNPMYVRARLKELDDKLESLTPVEQKAEINRLLNRISACETRIAAALKRLDKLDRKKSTAEPVDVEE